MKDYPVSFSLPKSFTGREPQHLLMTLLGDYWRGRQEHLPASAIVELLNEFEISETSARQAMRRLRNRHLLVHEKVGRQSYYGAADFVVDRSLERRRRVIQFGLEFTDWDRMWTVVTFSVPESDRDVRRHVRHGLEQLKFGMLYDAVWMSPHNKVEEALKLLSDLEVADATVMRSEMIERPHHPRSYADTFGLEALEADYCDFIKRFEPFVIPVANGQITPSDALVLRTEVMSTWLQFRRLDPNLPAELIPPQWSRGRAREVAYSIYDGLGAAAEARFRQILQRADPELAKLSSHFVSTDDINVLVGV